MHLLMMSYLLYAKNINMIIKEGDIITILDSTKKARVRVVFDTKDDLVRYTTIKKYRKWKRDFKLIYLQTTDTYELTGSNINDK